MNTQNIDPRQGMDVYGSDGEKVGEVDLIEQDYFVVRKGFFFPQDHYIPKSAISSADDDAIHLNVTKDGALEQQWNEAPVQGDQTGMVGSTGMVENGTFDATAADPNLGETPLAGGVYDDSTLTEETPYDDANLTNQGNLGSANKIASDTDTDTIEVREEDLQATTREVDRGAVRVDTRVVEEERSIDVPVTEEEVHINRRAVDRPVDSADFQDSTIEVPIRGEEVDVSKTARVVEEIDIDKSAHERTEHVSDTVRHEEVEITGEDQIQYDNDDRGILDKAKDAMNPDDTKKRR